jgi:PAS domain S-box-containing protein
MEEIRQWETELQRFFSFMLIRTLLFLVILGAPTGLFSDTSRPLIVGTELDFPPYSFIDDEGEPAGLNVDLTRAVAGKMGIDIEIRIGPWGDIRRALETGEIDAIAGMFYSAERDTLVDFSPPFAEIHYSFFRRQGVSVSASLEGLRGRRILVMRGDIVEDYLMRNGFADELYRYDTLKGMMAAFAGGEGEFAAAAHLPALYYLRRLGIDGFEPESFGLDAEEYCFAVREGDRALWSDFTEGLDLLKQSGEYKRLQFRWLGVLNEDSFSLGDVLRYVSYILVPLGLIALAAILWGFLMRREVRARTAELQREILRRDQAEERLEHINRVLEAVRQVNQLIVRGESQDSLMDRICTVLEESRGYFNVWIALFDNEGRFREIYESGLGEMSGKIRQHLGRGKLPPCVTAAAESNSILLTEDPGAQCPGCPLTREYEGRSGMTIPLVYGGRRYGFLFVSTPRRYFRDNAEQELLQGVGDDIGYALHDLEMTNLLNRATTIVQNSRIVLFRWENREGWPVSYVSENVRRFGYEAEEFLGGKVRYLDILHPVDAERVTAEVTSALASKENYFLQEYRLVDGRGTDRWVEDRTTLIRDAGGNVIAMEGIVFDITERRVAEAQQRQQDARLRAIIESAEDMIHLKNCRLEYTHVNSAFAVFMRRSRESMIGITDMELLPAGEAELSLRSDRLVLAGSSYRGEATLLVEGQELRVETIKVPVRDDTGEIIAVCAISRDISEAVRIRNDLESALEEKNVLLRELYHRTKNNMQVIASMVALRRFGLEDEIQQAVLQEIEGKIHSMALVHKRLYQTRDLSRLDIKAYIEELAELIHTTFENRTKNIRFRFDLEQAHGLIDTAVPLGLVLNELLVNSIKHAFTGRDSGEILISMRTDETDGIELNVRDNGIGLPEGFNPAEADTLGLQTVYSIVEGQLNGSIEYLSTEGTEWQLKLGSVDYRERV